MQPLIRKATEEDIAAILSLWRELNEFHTELDPQFQLVPDAGVQGEKHLRTHLDAPGSLLAVAERGAAIAGYCLAAVREQSPIFERRRHGFVSDLHVAASQRRHGVGTSLFEYVQRWFRERGVSRIELMTHNANACSNAFWESIGCEAYMERRRLELAAVRSPR